MHLRSQPRREYNVFKLVGEAKDEQIVMLQFDEHMDLDEQCIMDDEAEWMFLTETLGWKEGMLEADRTPQTNPDVNVEAVTLAAEYMFLTKQMGWK